MISTILIAIFLFVGAVSTMVYFIVRASIRASKRPFTGPLPNLLPLEGISIPVGGVSSVGRLQHKPTSARWSSYTVNPALTLYEDRFKFWFLGWRSRELSAIRQVDVYEAETHIRIDFHRGSPFYAYVPNREALVAMVRFFQRKGLSLGSEAQRLIRQ